MQNDNISSRIRDQFCAEQFLFREAELLDDFRLLDWLLLLDRAIDYRIPIRCTRPQDELNKAFSATTFHMIEHFGSLVSAERHDELREHDGVLKLARRVVLLDHTTLPLPNLSVVL